jgi:hypothetical protein
LLIPDTASIVSFYYCIGYPSIWGYVLPFCGIAPFRIFIDVYGIKFYHRKYSSND